MIDDKDLTYEDFFNVKYKETIEVFTSRGLPTPDYIFLSGALEKDQIRKIPFNETRSSNPGRYLKGCYTFFQRDGLNNEPFFAYSGRAARVKNRISTHYQHSAIWEKWANLFKENGLAFCPVIAIWITDKNIILEDELITKLTPVYNKKSA